MTVGTILECPDIQDTMFGEATVAEMSDPDIVGCLCSCGCKSFADRATNSSTNSNVNFVQMPQRD